MGRNIIKAIILLLLILILNTLLSFEVSAQKNLEKVIAVVLHIDGALEFRESANHDWKPVKEKRALFYDNQLRTLSGNKALIVYTTGTRVFIYENTWLEVSAYFKLEEFPNHNPKSLKTKLFSGEVYSKIRKDDKYEVETPVSFARAYGTEFYAKYLNGEATFLAVINDVEITNQFGRILLQEFQITTVKSDEAPKEATNVTYDEIEKICNWAIISWK